MKGTCEDALVYPSTPLEDRLVEAGILDRYAEAQGAVNIPLLSHRYFVGLADCRAIPDLALWLLRDLRREWTFWDYFWALW